MKGADAVARQGKKLLGKIEQYKFVLLVLLAGLLLLLLPTGSGTKTVPEGGTDPPELSFDLEGLEEKLARTLSQVEGAGKVSVVLTVKASTRQVLAQNIQTTDQDGGMEERRDTVVISQGTGKESAVPLQQIYPQFQGALVVCPGGEIPDVRLKLVEAVSALTGLGADKISICKGT